MSKPPVMTTPSKKAFYDAAVKELNLDVRDPFTNLLANALALVDQRDALKLELSEALARCEEAERKAKA